MKRIVIAVLRALFCAGVVFFADAAFAAPATFFRAINLNGPALTIDSNTWEGDGAGDFTATGKAFENQTVALRPPTDAARTKMIRSSRWGGAVDLTLSSVPSGAYQVFLYVWEDNHSEQFKLLVNDQSLRPWPGLRSGESLRTRSVGWL
jgi:hypothetical protein